ncbi:MAG: HAD family hydrolase [Patescibacteria group bacterium]|nr:HAD family hydrolase [Patescibacteria group bacterium]
MKAIIFDFDGVIGDTKELNYLIVKIINPNLSIEDFEKHHNGNVIEEPLFEIPEDFFEIQRDEFTKNNLFPLLDEIRYLSDKYSLFIVSSGREDNLNYFLKLGEIDSCFKEVLGCQFSSSKIKKIEYLLDKYSLKKNEVLFITDTIGDLKEAKIAGIESIAVSWGYHHEDLLKTEKPFQVIHNFEELKGLIDYLE